MSSSKQASVNPQLYQSMDRKATEELLAIWHENNREAWTDEAFAAVQAVLLNRLGSVPAQGALLAENELPTADERGAEEEALFGSQTLVFLATWSNRLAWLVLGVSVLLLLLRIVEDMNQSFPTIPEMSFAVARLSVWVSYLYSLLIGVVYFVLLQAVSVGARFLEGRNAE